MKPYIHAAGSSNRITKALRHTGKDDRIIPYFVLGFLLMEDGSHLLLENNKKIIWIKRYQI